MFLERFYIYEQKNILDNAAQKILDTPLENIEEQFSVVIISTKSNEELDNINGDLIWQFGQKKIKLNKFWITQETLDALTNGSIYKVYDQGYSRFKVLTKFLIYENDVYAIAKPMPAMTETINIVNKFIVILMGIAAILITCLLWILTKKVITNPLEILKDLSQDIANLKFRKVEINTNDEMAQLGKSINKMSEDIEKAYNESNEKNIRLKDLLSNVSHELKTPLSLIKVYAQGKSDGLDDGTYDIIIDEQLDKMELLIEKLLFWVKIDSAALTITEFNLYNKIESCLKKYQLIFSENNIQISFTTAGDSCCDDAWLIAADEQSIDIVLDNIITNAIKYTSNKKIAILLTNNNNKIELTVSNGADNMTSSKLEQMWLPFFVLEKSRNKELSGTGLGLPIVKSILESHNFPFGFSIKDSDLIFHVTLL